MGSAANGTPPSCSPARTGSESPPGRTATVSRPEATSARETLTPFPPDSWLTDMARCTSPRARGAGSRHGAVEAGVGGEGDDHAITTSTPASAKGRCEFRGLGSLSVIKVSRSFNVANWTSVSASSLDESASTTMRRADCDEGCLDGGFFRIGRAQPEGRVDAVGADEGDVRTESGGLRPRWTARRRPG